MRIAHANAIALVGLKGYAIDVQVQMASGLPALHLVGLPDAAVKEARHRVRAAINSIGVTLGDMRSTINLAPATLPKTGSGFDLAIAAALLAARQDKAIPARTVFVGELSLDGEVIPVPGILPSVKAARSCGYETIYVPTANQAEAELISGVTIKPVSHLLDLVADLGLGEIPASENSCKKVKHSKQAVAISTNSNDEQLGTTKQESLRLDLSDIVGQDEAKLALEIVAVGGHHWFLSGSPGAGKTMLARRLPTVLPRLDQEAAMEVAAIRSINGDTITKLDYEPPFEAPHHGISFAGLIGGGSKIGRPGAVTRAHAGVLFLDEAAEFSPTVLDGMRQVIETGTVNIERSLAVTSYPARFQLVLAANPCPCGRHGTRAGACECTPMQIRRYRQRLSGPLLDRIDISTSVSAPTTAALVTAKTAETSETVRKRVIAARAAAAQRWSKYGFTLNSQIPPQLLRSKKWESVKEKKLLYPLIERGIISLRGADKVRRIAWSLADLEGNSSPDESDLAMALELRIGAGIWS